MNSPSGSDQQVSDRDMRGERHEAGYNSDTRMHANQLMPAPEYRDQRGVDNRPATERVSASRDEGPNDRDAKASARSSDDSKRDSKKDSEKNKSTTDNRSEQKQQE
jgi:hypothetical protein